MDQLVSDPPPPGSFGAFLRACRYRACLSQEQLAARAEPSERTVRNLEAGRLQSPRIDTMLLLADALQLREPERASWFAADRGYASPVGRARGTHDGRPGAVAWQCPCSTAAERAISAWGTTPGVAVRPPGAPG